MARIRTIKPEFPQSESMGRVSRDARLLFVLLWTIADDSGRLRGNSRMLASLLFPYDDDAPKLITKWLDELVKESCIVLYIVDGQSYLQICNWLNHQKIDKPSPSKLPQFDSSREDSRILPVGREGNGRDQGEEGKGKGKGVSPADAGKKTDLAMLLEIGAEEQSAKDWLTIRKAKRAPLTQTALDSLILEAGKAGITPAQAIAICAKKSWQGFNSKWNWSDSTPSGDMRFMTPGQRKMAVTDQSIAEWLSEGNAVDENTIEGECKNA